MIQERERAPSDEWGPINDQQECEFCGRSLIGRFGGQVSDECDSCAADFKLLNRASKIRQDGWSLVVVKIDE